MQGVSSTAAGDYSSKRSCSSGLRNRSFLPVDIQHNQCPCRFVNPRRDTSSLVTKLRQRYYVVSGTCNAMSSYWIRQARPTYTFYKIEKRKETKKKQNKGDKSKEKNKKDKIQETNCRPPPPEYSNPGSYRPFSLIQSSTPRHEYYYDAVKRNASL